MNKLNKILGIDTSCDDTSIAVVNNKLEILANIVSSQAKILQQYGGVYPSIAKREHNKNLPIVLKQALNQHKGCKGLQCGVDAIAVTMGPGLDPCLWQGINFAKDLARKWNLPIIPVNHIEAHLIANFLTKIRKISNFQSPHLRPAGFSGQAIFNEFPISNFQKIMPAIGLVVSGGNTQLILVKNIGDYEVLGETRDDAAGECLDKTARILGLPYPGGPAIAVEAAKFPIPNFQFPIKLPRPMLESDDYDFSFSGLKTAVLYDYKARPKKIRESKAYIRSMAQEIQQAIIDVLLVKTIKAVKQYQAKTILLGGGVAANQELSKQFKKKIASEIPNLLFLMPNSNFCTDNGAMIAATAFFHQNQATQDLEKITAKPNLKL